MCPYNVLCVNILSDIFLASSCVMLNSVLSQSAKIAAFVMLFVRP